MSANQKMIALEEKILETGFSHYGIARPHISERDISFYKQWINTGNHGSMQYLEKSPAIETRQNLEIFLPGCKSIIVFGIRYPVDRFKDEKSGLFGKISSYSWGYDYHDVIKSKLKEIISLLTDMYGDHNKFRIAIDSSPVLEKSLAENAGIGWIGNNSCVIHPTYGSCFFLANIFTTIDLEPVNQPVKNRCGSCRKCIDSCPTGCILPDRSIDARQCISYLTIENKGEIPRELRAHIGQRLFGCDVCQSVCPWNKKPSNDQILSEFLPASEDAVWADLSHLCSLTDTDFRNRFKGSPISRAKRSGLIRNACVVLGNHQSPEAIPLLSKLLQSEPDPQIRSHAAWAMGNIQSAVSLDVLSKCLNTEKDSSVISEISLTLSKT